jgi:isopenicillin N synthase-like dioxygenase
MPELPIIDFEPFLSVTSSATEKQNVAAKIDEACRNQGFFYLIGHGVPQDLLDQVRMLAREFFDGASDAEKAKLATKQLHEGGDNARGYQKISHPERGSHEVGHA